MKQACSLESMVDAVLSEMKRRGNAKNTIERHERAYSQFYEYALTQGENSYSKVLARSFLEEKEKLSAYRGPRFMEQYRIALNILFAALMLCMGVYFCKKSTTKKEN